MTSFLFILEMEYERALIADQQKVCFTIYLFLIFYSFFDAMREFFDRITTN
jgi:hypothetical protein